MSDIYEIAEQMRKGRDDMHNLLGHVDKLGQEVHELRGYLKALAAHMGVEVIRRPSRVEVVRLGAPEGPVE